MKINDNNYDAIYSAMCKLGNDYNIKWFDRDALEGYMDESDLLSIIEDLVSEIDILEEKYEDLKQDLEDNYKPIPQCEQYEISDRDF